MCYILIEKCVYILPISSYSVADWDYGSGLINITQENTRQYSFQNAVWVLFLLLHRFIMKTWRGERREKYEKFKFLPHYSWLQTLVFHPCDAGFVSMWSTIVWGQRAFHLDSEDLGGKVVLSSEINVWSCGNKSKNILANLGRWRNLKSSVSTE